MITFLGTSLPRRILRALQAAPGVTSVGSAPVVISLVDSVEGETIFKNYLMEDPMTENYDPVLIPFFGHPVMQFVTVPVQVEVYNLLNTFQSLMANHFAPNGPEIQFQPIIQWEAVGIHFHHAKAAISAVMAEITKCERFAQQCPNLAALPSGNVICNLEITCAGAIIRIRLRKF